MIIFSKFIKGLNSISKLKQKKKNGTKTLKSAAIVHKKHKLKTCLKKTCCTKISKCVMCPCDELKSQSRVYTLLNDNFRWIKSSKIIILTYLFSGLNLKSRSFWSNTLMVIPEYTFLVISRAFWHGHIARTHHTCWNFRTFQTSFKFGFFVYNAARRNKTSSRLERFRQAHQNHVIDFNQSRVRILCSEWRLYILNYCARTCVLRHKSTCTYIIVNE